MRSTGADDLGPAASPGAVEFYEALGFDADRVGDSPEYPGFLSICGSDLRQ